MTLDRWRKTRQARNIGTLGMVVLGPLLALLTFLIFGPLGHGASSRPLRLILLADMVYIMAIAALVLTQIVRLFAARRSKSAGSRLHLRLIGAFGFLALGPTVIVAVFAVLTVNVGLEGWFSQRVRQVIGSSLSAAEAYQEEQRRDIAADAQALARFLDQSRSPAFL